MTLHHLSAQPRSSQRGGARGPRAVWTCTAVVLAATLTATACSKPQDDAAAKPKAKPAAAQTGTAIPATPDGKPPAGLQPRPDPSAFAVKHEFKAPLTVPPPVVPEPVVVFAPAALTGPLGELAAAYEAKTGQTVRIRGGDPEALAREILERGEAHLYISDDNRWMRGLGSRGRLITGTKQPWLTGPGAAVTAAAPAQRTYAIVGVRANRMHPGAEAFYDFAVSRDAAAVYEKHGFTPRRR